MVCCGSARYSATDLRNQALEELDRITGRSINDLNDLSGSERDASTPEETASTPRMHRSFGSPVRQRRHSSVYETITSVQRSSNPFMVLNSSSQEGEIENQIFHIHNAIKSLLSAEAKVKTKKAIGEDKSTVVCSALRDALVRKADLLGRASLVFSISQEDILKHFREAEHYGFTKTDEREEQLRQMYAHNQVYTLERLNLSQPQLLELPQIDSNLKPGVPNYLIWLSEATVDAGCFCTTSLRKLRGLRGVQVLNIGTSSTRFRTSEQPRENVLYVKHPNIAALYIPSSNYQSYLLKETTWAFVRFLNLLGATEVVFDTTEEQTIGKELTAALSEGHVESSAKIQTKASSSESTSITIQFDAKQKGYKIPYDQIERLAPYQRIPQWKDLRKLREQCAGAIDFSFSEDTSGLNRTAVALKIMQAGIEGAKEKSKKQSREIKCKVTFTQMSEYQDHSTVAISEEGFIVVQNLSNSEHEMILFADRFAKEYGLKIPMQNRDRLYSALKQCSGEEAKRGFDFFLHSVYVNISQGPEGLLQVLNFGNEETFSQFLGYALEDLELNDPIKQAITSEVVRKMLLFSRTINETYANFQSGLPSEVRTRIYQIFLNVCDDLKEDKIAFAREGKDLIEASKEPRSDTLNLLNENWDAFIDMPVERVRTSTVSQSGRYRQSMVVPTRIPRPTTLSTQL